MAQADAVWHCLTDAGETFARLRCSGGVRQAVARREPERGRRTPFLPERTAAGESSPFSKGSLVRADGSRSALTASDVALSVLDDWTSDATGVRYPVAWRMTLPKAGMTLDVRPYLENQELNLTVRYWEGAVEVEGRGADGPLSGQGYLELAGY